MIRTPRLVIASAATAVPMGAEVYQEQVASRASAALALHGPWTLDRVIVRSLRSPLPGNRRIPMGAVTGASPRIRRAVGRTLYGRGAVVHRMNLELPPSPHGDVVTLHDVVSWRFPDESAPVRAAVEEIRAADAVICVSAFSAGEAASLLGVKDPVVVHNGVDERFFDAVPLTEKELAALGVSTPYILAAGGASRRKNLDALAEAWPVIRSVHPELSLVLVGPPHPRRTEMFAGRPGVHLAGRVGDEVVPGLIAGATAAVVPSLYEGFGLPALEAMAAGTPVVASNASALPEVVGDGGLLVEPTARGLADGVIAVVDGGSGIVEMVARGRERAGHFTWERSARGHAAVWARVAGG